MIDRLPAIGIRIDDHTISGLGDSLALRQLRRQPRHLTDDQRILHIGERRDVRARNDDDVRRRLRIDVAEGDALRRLRDELRGNLAADDAAEEAVVRHALARWRRTAPRARCPATRSPPYRS